MKENELAELYELAGELKERNRTIKILDKISIANEIGAYVYVQDLIEYLLDPTEPGND